MAGLLRVRYYAPGPGEVLRSLAGDFVAGDSLAARLFENLLMK